MKTAVVSGEVHIGKTTVCNAVVQWARVHGYRVGGILTPPIVDHLGERVGIAAVDLATNERRELARIRTGGGLVFKDENWAGGPTIGPHSFSLAALQWGQEVVARAISEGCDLLVVDEIGRLELEHETGFSQVLDLLCTSRVPRSMVVVRKPLLERFQHRLPDLAFATFEVTLDNRDAMPSRIVRWLFPIEKQPHACRVDVEADPC